MPVAMDVEDLVIWAFRDQQIEAVARRLWPQLGNGSVQSGLAQILALGCRVDTPSAGSMHMAVQCHEDAAVIYDAVMSLPSEAWMLVITNARNATRPDWYEEGPGRYVEQLDADGRAKKQYLDPTNRKGFIGYARPLLEGTDPLEVEEGRRAYAVWWFALVDLVGMINAEMVDHEAIGPAVAARPWEAKEGVLTTTESLT